MRKFFTSILTATLVATAFAQNGDAPTVPLKGKDATLSNGIITLGITGAGEATSLKYEGSKNLFMSAGIYFDFNTSKSQAFSPDKAEIVRQTDDLVEVLYSNTKSDPHRKLGFILRKGVSGVYVYAVFEGTPGSANDAIREARINFRPNKTFLDGYVDDQMQGMIPSPEELKAVENTNKIQDATWRMPDGSIYTKYNWAQFVGRDLFHGLMNGEYGLWDIPVSYEWINGGPLRQELTVHATNKSPISLQMIQGEHFGGAAQAFGAGESKLYGPIFIYVNKGTREEMIADARREALAQQEQWPFQWFENELYPRERTMVSGRIELKEHPLTTRLQVLLGVPGTEIIRQGKDYMFWAETDENGNFSIPNVRPGEYSLYAYALNGDVSEELEVRNVSVSGESVDLGNISWKPTTFDRLLWKIGDNNRLSDSFNMSDSPRAYGLYKEVPANLTFKVGESEESTDWYYAQCKDGRWTVEFELDEVPEGTARLTASVAGSAQKPSVSIFVNGEQVGGWGFPNNDACTYRSAVQAGRHSVKEKEFPASKLKVGTNQITLQLNSNSSNGGIMWDMIKLETGTATGLSEVTVSTAHPYEVFTLQGIKIGAFVDKDEIQQLPAGVYIWRSGSEFGKTFVR